MSTLPPIQLTGHGIEITQILKDFVTNKFNHLGRHGAQITSIHVILNVDKLRQIAEAKLHILYTGKQKEYHGPINVIPIIDALKELPEMLK